MNNAVEIERKALKDLVPVGSIGADRIAQIPNLGVRFRPETIFQQPLKSLPELTEEGLTNLTQVGFMIVRDILSRPANEKLIIYPLAPELEGGLDNYIRSLEILHETRFVHKLYGGSPLPVPPQRESEIVEGVKAVLKKGRERYKSVIPFLISRYGLDNGITRTTEEINQERLRGLDLKLKNEEKALKSESKDRKGQRVLKQQPGYREQLMPFLTLPEQSLGREVFKAVLIKDLPSLEVGASIYELGLSSGVFKEVEKLCPKPVSKESYPTIWDLITVDLSKRPSIHGWSKFEIAVALWRRIIEIRERSKREAEKMARIKEQKWIEEVNKILNRPSTGKPVNNFLPVPDYEITEQEFEKYDYIPVKDLGLKKRTLRALRRGDFITVGLILRKTPKELSREVRNFAEKSYEELRSELIRFVEQDKEN